MDPDKYLNSVVHPRVPREPRPSLLRRWLTINNFTMTLAFVFLFTGGLRSDGLECLAGGILLVLWFVQGQGDDITALRREVAELRALVREGRES